MTDKSEIPELMGNPVVDASGEEIGKVGQVYVGDASGEPEWVAVQTDLLGRHEKFVPLVDAEVDGDTLVVPVDPEVIATAPEIDEDGHIEPEQEIALQKHYGLVSDEDLAGTDPS